MANPDKALLKAAAHDEAVAMLSEALLNAEKNGLGLAASRDTTERLFARIAGYKNRIDKAFEDGTFQPDARGPVYAVFRDVVSIVQDSHRALVSAAAEQVPFAAGLRKAISMTKDRAQAERNIAARSVELEDEDRATDPETASPVAATVPPGDAATQGATDTQPEPPASARAVSDEGSAAVPEQPEEVQAPEVPPVELKRRPRRARRADNPG